MANHRTVVVLTPAENPAPRYATLEEALLAAVPALTHLIQTARPGESASLTHVNHSTAPSDLASSKAAPNAPKTA